MLSLGRKRGALQQRIYLASSVPRTRSQSRAARAQARDAEGRTQGGGSASSDGSTRGSSSGTTDYKVAGTASREHRTQEKSSVSDPEAAKHRMIQYNVSPSSDASSPTPSLAWSDTALSVGSSSPRYVPRSHAGTVAARRPSRVMQHGKASPETTAIKLLAYTSFRPQKIHRPVPPPDA